MAKWLSSVNRLASCRPAPPVVTLQALGAAHDRVQGEQEFRRPNGLANAPLEDHGLVHNSPPHGREKRGGAGIPAVRRDPTGRRPARRSSKISQPCVGRSRVSLPFSTNSCDGVSVIPRREQPAP